MFDYDPSGRVISIVAPTGERTAITSKIGDRSVDNLKMLTVAVAKQRWMEDPNTVSLTQGGSTYFSHGE